MPKSQKRAIATMMFIINLRILALYKNGFLTQFNVALVNNALKITPADPFVQGFGSICNSDVGYTND